MRVTAIYTYPIKALRGIRLDEARLGPQGIEHDRRFMLCRVEPDGQLRNVTLAGNPQCALFAQDVVGPDIHVRYLAPHPPVVPPHPHQDSVLRVPLRPDVAALPKVHVNLHQSLVDAHRMGSPYDDWFAACFGFPMALIFIGDERRPILGTFAPQPPAGTRPGPPPWLAFSDVAPLLFASEQSLRNVSARLSGGTMDMVKFRPNIVVDGEAEFDEDYWADLSVHGEPAFTLTKMCCRCSSINVDYDTGRLAQGDDGIVLKKLMADRRVDLGYKYSPVFGKYGFLAPGRDCLTLRVGDPVAVESRSLERPVCDWPLKSKSDARFYQYSA
ncbi:MOSC domain-containing protein [Hirsutella rhossiliensis]|uniref:MOSC domain-containing protein n=1 Tax=Hirsutella rhossiliensis TaxID=111463 RepID=A0A9P8SLH2_9HYPO|nr:MOSC domain-containing protein [Hirsutella rhossiliensis]KAH0965810.1 MOSC domain-containing protein [Hirsutella rhossiliensis]